ncbi:glycosyltransferase [Deinococcus metallilatus]|uniref:Glycosyltransferase family 4 protein n=1 Tax=Deinococcus metallilatus TaxID=1211322 RepID=A0AAJ5F2A9_9DEIO|nr:glycosyltransferase family 4 protein [Deinococcus metallilatus]MBB5296817.1 glycosyltransferase involved in cell wall biosynthesis [Deinococcus metallilatus]QBY09556.1 glycosyltransferase [Deinococcus metallilatus]RXJ09160.1 glycosyltransferase [Deinococcus metallilatus]TLK22796.1 glycosyltransferase family 4 protein [Deinococcus metallilatus]
MTAPDMTAPARPGPNPGPSRMRRALYVSIQDSSDRRSWSGTSFRMRECLKEAGYTVECVDALTTFTSPATRAKAIWSRMVGKKYVRDRTPFTLRRYARQIERRAASLQYDFVFSSGSMPIALLRERKPIVCWGDATFGALLNFYEGLSGLSRESEALGHRLEALALRRAAAVIYASEWAAQSAVTLYGIDPAKVHVVPFGANVDVQWSDAELEGLIAQRLADGAVKLLFIGVEWDRKGGPVVLEVARLLQEAGVPCELHVAGVTPPGPLPAFVKLHGFLNKNTPEGIERLSTLLRESHFFLMPSQAECFGIVFAEASAYALPSVGTRVGGIPSAVTPGVNGLLFDPGTPPAEIAQALLDLWRHPAAYAALCRSAYQEYTRRLNWHAAGQALRRIIEGLTPPGQGA